MLLSILLTNMLCGVVFACRQMALAPIMSHKHLELSKLKEA
jgi:hypothetical protein